MPSAVITCPSGLTGEIRSLPFKELRKFAKGAKASLSRSVTAMLQACWLRTDNPGPYGDKFTWGQALYGDRVYAWIQSRILGFGPEIDYEFQCDFDPCRERFPGLQPQTGHLDTVGVRLLSPASRETLKSGNRFETTIAGTRVVFRLLTGDIEAEIEDRQTDARRRREDRTEAQDMAELLISVEGVEPGYLALVEWVDNLDAGDVARLGQTINEAGCSVDLGAQPQCEHCHRVVKVQIPFVENFTTLAKKGAEPST